MLKLYLQIQNLVSRERGASMAEYGILVTLIAIIAVAGTAILGQAVNSTLMDAGAAMP